MVDPDQAALSITRQCRLLSIARSSFYYEGTGESPLNLRLMRRIDEQFLETPFYGSRQMTRWLLRQGARVSRKRVRRLMRLLGLQAIFQRPRTSQPHPAHRVYPYLLRADHAAEPHLDGWQGLLDGQCVHRAVVAIAQIRVRLPVRVRYWLPGPDWNRPVDGLLRPAPAPLGAQRPDAAGSVH